MLYKERKGIMKNKRIKRKEPKGNKRNY